jgi:hypothetical protein
MAPKWPGRVGSDAVDLVRGPTGLFVVLVDVQGSGATGNRLAGELAAFLSGLLESGVDASVALTATSQRLARMRDGKVLASLLVADGHLPARSVCLHGLGRHMIVTIAESGEEISFLESDPAGLARGNEPARLSVPLSGELTLVLPNDGLASTEAAWRNVQRAADGSSIDPNAVAILDAAVRRDAGRPRSDMAVAVLASRWMTGEGRQAAGSLSITSNERALVR